MNMWKKNPSTPVSYYSNFDDIMEEFDPVLDMMFVESGKSCLIMERSFVHISYTPYKNKATVKIMVNNKKRKVRLYMLNRVHQNPRKKKHAEIKGTRCERVRGVRGIRVKKTANKSSALKLKIQIPITK